MRKYLLVSLLLLVLAAPAASAGKQPLGSLGSPVLGAVAAGVSTLAILNAYDHDTLWAAWDEYGGDNSNVRMALLRRKGRSVRPVWSRRYAEGYAPALDFTLGWLLNDRRVVMLRYQLGAAYVHVELYGLTKAGGVRALGNLEGALTEPILVHTDTTDATILRIWDTSDLKGPPHCTGWDKATGKLVPRDDCPP